MTNGVGLWRFHINNELLIVKL
uniref:Uncharacterized protein n=1 Tax=Lepeophtheirus salmonis TaxID=72036 RepID=A0A0K2UI53_LEPSM